MNDQEQREYREFLEQRIQQCEQNIQDYHDRIDRAKEEIGWEKERLEGFTARLKKALETAVIDLED